MQTDFDGLIGNLRGLRHDPTIGPGDRTEGQLPILPKDLDGGFPMIADRLSKSSKRGVLTALMASTAGKTILASTALCSLLTRLLLDESPRIGVLGWLDWITPELIRSFGLIRSFLLRSKLIEVGVLKGLEASAAGIGVEARAKLQDRCGRIAGSVETSGIALAKGPFGEHPTPERETRQQQ